MYLLNDILSIHLDTPPMFICWIWVYELFGGHQPNRANRSALIGINLRKSPSTSVGARAVGSGWEGLDGRPRPVPLAHLLEEHDPILPRGRPSRLTHQPFIHPRPYVSPGLLPDFPASVDAYSRRLISPSSARTPPTISYSLP